LGQSGSDRLVFRLVLRESTRGARDGDPAKQEKIEKEASPSE
jgi:hypothetical protein